jgi:hypothetical protein
VLIEGFVLFPHEKSRKRAVNVAPHILRGSKIQVISSRYISCMFLTYNTCGNYTISISVLYQNNITIYFHVKHAKNNYFPSLAKFEMVDIDHRVLNEHTLHIR